MSARAGEVYKLVVFRVAGQEYGVDIMQVRGIHRLEKLVPVSRAPHILEGLWEWKGQAIPVLSLARHFGLQEKQELEGGRVITVEVAGQVIGMAVDAVTETLTLPAAMVAPAPPFLKGKAAHYVWGVGKAGEQRLIVLLNLQEVLEEKELKSLQEAVRQWQKKEEESKRSEAGEERKVRGRLPEAEEQGATGRKRKPRPAKGGATCS
ncbi:MAG: chemotaxis protein CheW [Bacillota bacterium]|nr:chemotaxis protein CheW [Bacillota bacterium]